MEAPLLILRNYVKSYKITSSWIFLTSENSDFTWFDLIHQVYWKTVINGLLLLLQHPANYAKDVRLCPISELCLKQASNCEYWGSVSYYNKEQACLLFAIKAVKSSSLVFLSYNTTHCISRCHLGSLETWEQEESMWICWWSSCLLCCEYCCPVSLTLESHVFQHPWNSNKVTS